jgi:nitrate/nitrite-specific signal transduction histidine kinase
LLFLVLGLFLAALYRSVITSIRDLSNAAEAVSRADFSVSVDVSTTDEMAQVASSFNAMVPQDH